MVYAEKFDPSLWKKIRKDKEEERYREETVPPPTEEVKVSTAPPPAVVPAVIGEGVELPGESRLAITGRKLVSFKFQTGNFFDPQKKALKQTPGGILPGLDIQQELQVRVRGVVKRKVHVNVDYDDTKEDKRDILVVYKGDPEEVVQEAAFGDVRLSLPATEFVSYDKQVFGASGDFKYKGFRGKVIGSRAKGQTETRRFTGGTQLERKDIRDIDYIRRKFYRLNLKPEHLPIQPGSERIFLDDLNAANNQSTTQGLTVEQLDFTTATFSGSFDRLFPGQDYTVDYTRGILTLRLPVAANAVIAVDYTKAGGGKLSDEGTPGRLKILKTSDESFSQELKNIYSLGRTRIVRDDGKGNFILRVLDLSRAEPSALEPGNKPVPKYPADIEVDFEAGQFRFLSDRPFPDDAYNPSPVNRFLIFAEYRFRIKTYFLRPTIVFESERVVMDGKPLVRDVDYFIDYDSGFITFFDEEKITDQTVLEVTYEFATFGRELQNTILGSRAEYSFAEKARFGSTVLLDFTGAPPQVPDVRSPPGSLLVTEFDATLRPPAGPFLSEVGGEVARSVRNPNTAGRAMVDSMEGIRQEDAVPTPFERWIFSSNPDGQVSRMSRPAIAVTNENVKLKDLNPQGKFANPDEERPALAVNYDLEADREGSAAVVLSRTGLDFSRKLTLEMFIFGDGSGNTLRLTLGSLAEDSDGDGSLDTEDKNTNGTLDSGEDTGLSFRDPGPDGIAGNADDVIAEIGKNNGRLDTEDLDGDGKLDSAQTTGGIFGTPANPLVDSDGIAHTSVDWSGWKRFVIPLGITTANEAQWQAIQHFRISLRAPPGGGRKGTLKFAEMAVIGNRWEKPTTAGGGTLEISAVNNRDNPEYESLTSDAEFQELRREEVQTGVTIFEQALQLRYTLPVGSATASTREVFSRALDFTAHRRLRFWVFGDNSGARLSFRPGSETDFWRFDIPIDFSGWRLFTLNLLDLNNDGRPDTLGRDGTALPVQGNPNLAGVSQLKFVLENPSPSAKQGKIWINEVHLKDSFTRVGLAYRTNASLEYPNWFKLSGRYKEVDRNFETLTTQIFNRDERTVSGALDFTRISGVPLRGDISRSETITPSVVQTKDPNLISVQEEGRVVSFSGNASAGFQKGAWPSGNFRYGKTFTRTQQLRREDDTDLYQGDLSYTVPVRFPLLPTRISSTFIRTNAFRTFDAEVSTRPGNQNLKTFTNDYSQRASFSMFNRLTLDPSFQIQRSREQQDLLGGGSAEYPKSLNQTVDASAGLRIFRWLSPTGRYSFGVRETHDITNVAGRSFDKKFVDRSATGELSWPVAARDITRFKHFASLSHVTTFRVEDADSYENVESSFNAVTPLWIRGAFLKPTRDDARRKSFTLRDTLTTSTRYKPFEAFGFSGAATPIGTMEATMNLTNIFEKAEVTLTPRTSKTRLFPDLILRFTQLEKLFFAEKVISGSEANLKYSRRTQRTTGVSRSLEINRSADSRFNIFKWFDLTGTYSDGRSFEHNDATNDLTKRTFRQSWSTQLGYRIGSWRFTPRYQQSLEEAVDSLGRLSQDLVTRTPSFQMQYDAQHPTRIRLPWTQAGLTLTNRLIFTNNVSLAIKKSSLNIDRDNTTTLSIGSSADYFLSDNLRATFGLTYNRLFNRVKAAEDFQTLEILSKILILF